MKTLTEAGFAKKALSEVEGSFDVFKRIGSDWMLVTAGNEGSFNTMTASWGFAGIMWNKPCAVTVIRPQRYTKEFIDREETFTLSFYPEAYRKALGICGSKTGRDCDKPALAGLTPISAESSVAFEEAELVLVCRKLYAGTLGAEYILVKSIISEQYAAGDFHTAYIGEIIGVYTK